MLRDKRLWAETKRSRSGCQWQLLFCAATIQGIHALSTIHLPISDRIPHDAEQTKGADESHYIPGKQSAFAIRKIHLRAHYTEISQSVFT